MLARDSATLDCNVAHTESVDAAAWSRVAHPAGVDLFGASHVPEAWPQRVSSDFSKLNAFVLHGMQLSRSVVSSKILSM